MHYKKKILAISGSTRRQSSNHLLIKAIGHLFADRIELRLYNELAALPHFNPDLGTEELLPEKVKIFRTLIDTADGVLICTPEYAHGVPGTLKNAIDWTVVSANFSQKPTALITASTDGRFAHNALLETLRVIEAGNIDNHQLLIQFINAKVDEQGIRDPAILQSVLGLMSDFINTIKN